MRIPRSVFATALLIIACFVFVAALLAETSPFLDIDESVAETVPLDKFSYLPHIAKRPEPTRRAAPTSTFTSTPTNTPTATSGSAVLPTATETPTNTPTDTPTPTSTPTRTPTPTSTTAPVLVYVRSNHSAFSTSYGSFYIVGEVQNNSSDYLRFVKISANVFSSSGQLLDTDFTYTYLDNLPPGEKTCFAILFLDEPVGWAYYEFEKPSYWTDGDPLPNLTVFNDSGSYVPNYGWYEIIGQVRNDQGTRVEYVSPVGTVYNAFGTVLDCDFTYVNSTHLDAGQTSAFEMTFLSRDDYADVAFYRLQVDGNVE